jgi:hypothetical protein
MKYVQASARYSVVMNTVGNTHNTVGYYVVLNSHLVFEILTAVNNIDDYDFLRCVVV